MHVDDRALLHALARCVRHHYGNQLKVQDPDTGEVFNVAHCLEILERNTRDEVRARNTPRVTERAHGNDLEYTRKSSNHVQKRRLDILPDS